MSGDPGADARPVPMRLVVDLGNGEQHVEEVTGPGGMLRFAVGEFGRQAAVWRLWANKSTGDVYLACRILGNYQKFSLHQSGDWRYAWRSEEVATSHGLAEGRIIDRWSRPKARGGWTRAISIRVPHGHYTRVEPNVRRGDVLWLPEPGEGKTTVVDLMLVEPNIAQAQGVGIPVAAFLLATGEAVVLCISHQPTPTNVDPKIANTRFQIDPAVEVERGLDAEAGNFRSLLLGVDESGTRTVWDVCLRKTDSTTWAFSLD